MFRGVSVLMAKDPIAGWTSTKPPQSTRLNTRARLTTSVRPVVAMRSKPSPRRTSIRLQAIDVAPQTMNDDRHGPNPVRTDCPTGDQTGSQAADTLPRLATVKPGARGEDLRIVDSRATR
jgi:hypothetical protein